MPRDRQEKEETAKNRPDMQTEKIIRPVASLLSVAVFALCVSRRLLFPDAFSAADLPLSILLLLILWGIWGGNTSTDNENQ